MDDEMLIECVRQHVELYDIFDERYSDGSHKQRVWNEISQFLGHTAITCKKRWNNIRDNYRKSLKRQVVKSGLSRNVGYKYENQLIFLLPFMRERYLDRSSPARKSNEVSMAEGMSPVKREDNCDLQTRSAVNSMAMEFSPDWLRYDEEPTTRNEQSGREIPIEDDRSELIVSELTKSNYLVTSNDLTLQVASSHSVDAFLVGIAPILKSLSPYYLNIVKTDIFSIVQEAEMIQLMQRQERYRKAAGGQHLG